MFRDQIHILFKIIKLVFFYSVKIGVPIMFPTVVHITSNFFSQFIIQCEFQAWVVVTVIIRHKRVKTHLNSPCMLVY